MSVEGAGVLCIRLARVGLTHTHQEVVFNISVLDLANLLRHLPAQQSVVCVVVSGALSC
jgi:hypothetical protein